MVLLKGRQMKLSLIIEKKELKRKRGTFFVDEKMLEEYIAGIEPVDEKVRDRARARMDQLAKPPGSLGKLEDIAVRFASITGEIRNYIKKKIVVIMSSDNGVYEEGISPTPQSVTMVQTINFTRRITGVGALSKANDTELCAIDVGINGDVPKALLGDEMQMYLDDKIIDRKIRKGTSNIAKGPAMTRSEALAAIETGLEVTRMLRARDYHIVGVGEMGIGNTTTSAAVLKSLTGCSAEKATGRGGGLSDQGYEKKLKIVENAANRTKGMDVLDCLAEVGGFDICAMVGVYLGAAKNRIPVVIDGYISAVAALAAYKLAPVCKDYMFASHDSAENGYRIAMDQLGLEPMLNLDMRLGEGSGCVLAFDVIKGALGVMDYMGTYEEAKIAENYLDLMKDARFC